MLNKIGDLYDPVMTIQTQEQADKHFEFLVKYQMQFNPVRKEAIEVVKSNIGYMAGYHSHETRLRVEKLFNCEHPVLGKAVEEPPTPKECFEAGVKWAQKENVEKDSNN